ncbi:hypothetical protein VTI74DRAFT_1232 [Chaetomium olivicolor]
MRPDSLGTVIPRAPRVRDSFSRLPLEILLYIFRFLSGHDLLALLKASWPAFCAARSNTFWKRFLKQDMPWLTELWPLLEDEERQGGRELSYKALYLWLDKVTFPSYGIDGPFLPLANRRRIWGVCEQLARHYFRHLYARPLDEPDRSMVEGIFCRHIAIVSNNQPQYDPSAVRTTLFAYSMDELDNWPVDLEAYWGEDRRLVGLCAIVGKHRRVFGLDGTRKPHITKTAMRIPAGDRIAQLGLSVAAADPNEGPTASPGIVCIEVRTSVGMRPTLQRSLGLSLGGPETPCISTTSLTVSKEARLVGVTGHIDPDGTIRSLGLLEANPIDEASPPTLPAPPPRMPPCNHRLWARTCGLPYRFCGTSCPSDIYNVFALTSTPSSVSLVPDHMIPHEGLLWAKNVDELSKLERISLYVGPETAAGRTVHGMRAEYTRRYWEPKRYVGMRRNVGQYDDPPTWPEDQMVALEVDSPGGELIDEIAVSDGRDDALAIKIKTNKGREVTVGEDNGKGWKIQRAPAGESIIGLVAGFTGKTNVQGYGALSMLLVLTKEPNDKNLSLHGLPEFL